MYPSNRLLLTGLALCAISTSFAQLSLTPSVFETTSSAGVPKRITYTISNTGKSPIKCVIQARDLGMTPEGFLTGANETKRGCGEYLSITPSQFSLPAGQSKQVTAILRLPPGSGGGYYASIECAGFPERNQKSAQNAPRVEIVKRMSGALLVACTSARPQIKLKVASVGLVKKGSAWLPEAKVSNEGNIHFRASGLATILARNGSVLSRQPLNAGKGYLLPGSPRSFASSKGMSLPDGAYSVKVEVSGPGGMKAANTETFLIQSGKATKGELTPEMRAYLNASAPSVAIDRMRVHYQLPRRGKRRDSISIQNLTRENVTVHPILLNWSLDSKADLAFSQTPLGNGRGAVPFVRVSPERVALKPGQRARVILDISTPASGEGEYYGAVFFARSGESLPKDPKVLRSRSSILTLALKGTEKRTADVTFLGYAKRGNGGIIKIKVRNSGNAMIEPTGKITLMRGSKQVATPSFGNGAVLVPGSSAIFELATDALAAGNYSADILTKVHDGEKEASEQARFQVKK